MRGKAKQEVRADRGFRRSGDGCGSNKITSMTRNTVARKTMTREAGTRKSRLVAGFLLVAVVGLCRPVRAQTRNAESEAESESCSRCHSEIYKTYGKTGMANASGRAADGLIPGAFEDKTSDVRYRVYKEGDRVWMSYERASEKFRGQRELLYFIGSNRKSRSYFFSDQGFLFETPINWYSQQGHWGMMPALAEAKQIPMNLPALMDCMNCHSSGLQSPVAGTDNKFVGPPFQHDGITCQRCHGDGKEHGEEKAENGHLSATLVNSAEASRPGSIVNPAKLPANRRDSVCMECHFEGTVGVEQPGKHLYEFQPGEKLSDYIHYFLLSGNEPETGRALSQVEALALSECKRKSGDQMWCGTCHDPHAEPAAADKAAYYRNKCLTCHREDFAAKHHPEKPDCRPCHMPALQSKDVAHTQGTDHRILRYPTARPLPRLQVRGTKGAPLVAFPASDATLATTRDFALAWETLAQRNAEGGPQRAEEYLREAVQERPEDPVLLGALGLVEQKHGHDKEARDLYERALKADPLANDATANLAILEAQSGNLPRAVQLWQGAFARIPYRSAIGLNLAMAFCVAGQK